MLYYNTVNELLKSALRTLMESDPFSSFRLVGGTALSLHLGHRESIDIDLFSDLPYGSLDFESIDNYLKSQNASKGYEVSYEFKKNSTGEFMRVKTCLVCKDITLFSRGSVSVVVTESWSDFLALLTLYPKLEDRNDFIILNSVSMRDRLIEKINESNWSTIYSATDNDPAGLRILEDLIDKFQDRVIPLNAFYSGYKDVGEYLEKKAK